MTFRTNASHFYSVVGNGSLFLNLPIEIIEMIMNALNSDESDPGSLVALMLTHSLLYKTGLPIYYSTWFQQLIMCPFFSRVEPPLKPQFRTVAPIRHTLNGAKGDIFSKYPDLGPVIKSISIYDYMPKNSGLVRESNPNSQFLPYLHQRLNLFTNLTQVHIEVGHDMQSSILADLLINLPLPESLKSFMIIFNLKVFANDSLGRFHDRICELKRGGIDIHQSAPKFPNLEYLKIGTVEDDFYEGDSDGPIDILDSLEDQEIYDEDGVWHQAIFSNYEGFEQLAILLRLLVFKHGSSLKHLVLEGMPPFIFEPDYITTGYLLMMVRIDNEIRERLRLPDGVHYEMNELLRMAGVKVNPNCQMSPDRSQWKMSDSYDNGLPKLIMLEVNNGSVNAMRGQTYILNGRRQNDVYQPVSNGGKKVITSLSQVSSSTGSNSWITGFLRQEFSYDRSNNDTDCPLMIGFQKEMVIDCAEAYTLNLAAYQQELNSNSPPGLKRNQGMGPAFDSDSFKIPITYVTPNRWIALCQASGLDCC